MNLIDKIKAGKLKLSAVNVEKVKTAWIQEVEWNNFFSSSPILAALDPQGDDQKEEILANWLVSAYADHPEEKVREELAMARQKIITEANQ